MRLTGTFISCDDNRRRTERKTFVSRTIHVRRTTLLDETVRTLLNKSQSRLSLSLNTRRKRRFIDGVLPFDRRWTTILLFVFVFFFSFDQFIDDSIGLLIDDTVVPERDGIGR